MAPNDSTKMAKDTYARTGGSYLAKGSPVSHPVSTYHHGMSRLEDLFRELTQALGARRQMSILPQQGKGEFTT